MKSVSQWVSEFDDNSIPSAREKSELTFLIPAVADKAA